MANRTAAQAPFNSNVTTTEHKAPGVTFKVKSNSHAVQVFADYSIWDTTSNVHVRPEDTNFKDGK